MANSYDSNERFVMGAYANGDLNIFDLRTLKAVVKYNTDHPVCCIEARNKYGKLQNLVCGARQGNLQIYDFDENLNLNLRHKTIESRLKRPVLRDPEIQNEKVTLTTIWCVRHLPQNRNIFATCDGSGFIRLWNHR